MTPQEFIAKWKAADLKERAACQEHFLDLCRLLDQQTPAEADPTGAWYTFEKGVNKDTGGQGFADVWRRGFFGWEYKGKKKDLKAAYVQLCQYREALGNPPLLVVCDLNRFEVHTNFTGTIKEVHAFDLDGLADSKNVERLRWCFTDPDKLKPGRTQAQVTKDVADKFVQIADGMRARGVPADDAAHFLMKLMFCMFAEDIDLLPKDLFLKTVTNSRWEPKVLTKLMASLFEAMAHKDGTFGADPIPWVNGGLFADAKVIVQPYRTLATQALQTMIDSLSIGASRHCGSSTSATSVRTPQPDRPNRSNSVVVLVRTSPGTAPRYTTRSGRTTRPVSASVPVFAC